MDVAVDLPTLVMRDLGPFRSRILGLTARGQLVYGLQNGIVDVYTADIDPATRRAGPHAPVSARLQGSSISPDWSADGTHLAYVTDRGMVPNDWRSRSLTLRTAAENAQQIAPALSFFIKPRLSPDGASVLVKGRRHRGLWGLHQVNLARRAMVETWWPAADRLIFSRWTEGPKRTSTRERLALLPTSGGPLEDLGVEVGASPSRQAARPGRSGWPSTSCPEVGEAGPAGCPSIPVSRADRLNDWPMLVPYLIAAVVVGDGRS